MTLAVLKPGLLTTLQDAGRPGYAHLGVGRAGAFDNAALRIANALCGNPRTACGLEITLLGPTLRVDTDTVIAVTGAPLPVSINGREVPMWAVLQVPAHANLALGAMRSGCRSYLAVRGGVAAQPVLGSRSADVNAALGPLGGRPLRAGDVLAMGEAPRSACVGAAKWAIDPRPWFDNDPDAPLRLLPASHFDQLTEGSRKRLFQRKFTVQAASNRVGLRLLGPRLEWTHPIELVSTGCIPGVLQLPPSGEPIAFGPECPVSGGYPRIGQIAAVDMPRLAQRRPGDSVCFTPCPLDAATLALRQREQALNALSGAIGQRLQSGR